MNGREDATQLSEADYSDPNHFMKEEKHSDETIQSVISLCAEFVKDFVGEAAYDAKSEND